MKRNILLQLLMIIVLQMWSFYAFAQGNVGAAVTNNTTVMNGMAPDDIIVCIDSKRVFEDVQKAFSKFYTADDLAKNLNVIKSSSQYVENVVFDANNGVMTVTLADKTEQKFYNPLFAESVRRDKAIKEYKAADNKRIGKTVWIGNGLHYDTEFAVRTQMLQDLAQRLCNIGFDVTYTPTWNDSLMLNNDIILYHGHGAYVSENGTHWINTGITNNNNAYKLQLGMDISKEYNSYCISEEYINSKKTHKNKATKMKSNAFVYLAVCDLFNDNDNMARVFTKKGAAAIIGYDRAANSSGIYGAAFLDQLAKGKNIEESYKYLNDEFDGILKRGVQEDYAPGYKETLSFTKQIFWADVFDLVTHSKYSQYVYYHDIEGRKELTRLYHLLNGDSWDEASKKNWLSSLDISHWANVSYNLTNGGINVTIKDSKMNLPSDLTLENFNRIATITLPKDSKVNNLTIQNCKVLTHNPVIACNNLKIKGCPALYGIKLNGAKNVSIDDCEVLKELVISDALEVESLTVSNCKLLKDFECRSVSYSGKPESSLKSLNFKDCDMLHRVDIHGCPISGTLDLSNCKGLRYLSISVTNIQHIEVGELESLSVRQTPIKQTYESLPGVKKFYVQSKYMYTRMHKFEYEEKIPDAGEGFQYVGDLGDYHYYYKLNFDDGSGFYHTNEPIDPKYWNTQTIW